MVRRAAAPTPREMAGAGQLQRHRRPTPPYATTSATSGTRPPCGCRAAGPASGSCCTSSRPRTGPPSGWTTSRWSRTRAATRRSRPTSPTTCAPASRSGSPSSSNNTLSFQSIPPGVIEDTPAGRRQRYWHDFFNYAGIHRPVWLYTDRAGPPHRHHRRDRPGRRHRHRRLPRSRPSAADRATVRVRAARRRPGRRSPTGDGATGTLRSTTCTGGRRATATSTTWRSSSSTTAGTVRGQLPPERRRPHGRGQRQPVPDQRRAVLLHRLRQARGHSP